MTAPMVNLTIEGRKISVPAGTSILEAAKQVGVLIPHYCYHPGLPVAGVCRMCLVEVEKAPKLAPACASSVAEGQVVHVYSDQSLKAREGVLEMLLINHPLDCPICDQSGECELQDYTFQEGRADSRYQEPKRFNPVEDFGGDVLYVPNRCILCTRCVRFMDDVANDTALNVSERGDRAVIGKSPGHDLTHPWAGNVVDLCPVGALLSKDFLNKARAWELDRTASVCPNCSQGCNTTLETRDNVVVRMKPRSNDDVNKFFLCNEGRADYRWINRTDRIVNPLVKVGDEHKEADWDVALATAASALRNRRVFVLASPRLSNEALYLLKRLVARVGGAGAFRVAVGGAEQPLAGVKDLALRVDRAPNGSGAALMGFARSDDPLAAMKDSDVLLVADQELTPADIKHLSRASLVLFAGTAVTPEAAQHISVALPLTNFAEEEGTFTNLRGRVQRFLQAKAGPALARPSWFVLLDLLALLGDRVDGFVPGDVFNALARDVPAFKGMSYDSLGLRGAVAANGAGGAGGAGGAAT
jgi:NADH-quinone oxidoreductase subunit G